jgi:exodeoxyribonuclease-3
MRVVTWNVNSIRARAERVGAWIDRQQPDVLCIQETRVADDAFPTDLFLDRGYSVEIFGQGGRNGVCIAARDGLTLEGVSRGFPGDDEEAEKRVIAATVGGMRIINVYVVNGQEVDSDKYRYKLQWMARLRDLLESEAAAGDVAALCVGDFNIAPEAKDIWAPEQFDGQVLCSDPERAAWRRFLDAGFEDLHRRFTDQEVFTWWDYRSLGFPKNKGWRIDHVLATPAAAAGAVGVEVDRQERKGKQPSDHAPVIATFSD